MKPGIHWYLPWRKWLAVVASGERTLRIGRFADRAEAQQALDLAEKFLHSGGTLDALESRVKAVEAAQRSRRTYLDRRGPPMKGRKRTATKKANHQRGRERQADYLAMQRQQEGNL